MSISFTPTCKPLGTIACNNALRLVRQIRTRKPPERFQRQSSLLQVAHTPGYPGWVRTNREVKMRTTALRPLRTGRKTQKIGPKWTENWSKFALLDTRDRFRKRVGVTQSGCWVVQKTLILQGFSALAIWKNQRKTLVDTKLIPLPSRHRIMSKSLKARKFVFLRTNLRAFCKR